MLSRTPSKTVDKACLLDMTVPAADGADHPTAIIASPPGDQTHGTVGGDTGWSYCLVPVHSEHKWVFCCPFKLTSLTWPDLRQDLSVPIKTVTQQCHPAGGIIAMLQGQRGSLSAPAAPLCTAAWCPWALTTTRSNTAQSKVLSL